MKTEPKDSWVNALIRGEVGKRGHPRAFLTAREWIRDMTLLYTSKCAATLSKSMKTQLRDRMYNMMLMEVMYAYRFRDGSFFRTFADLLERGGSPDSGRRYWLALKHQPTQN